MSEEKQIGNKKNKLRRAFIVSAIVTAVSAGVGIAVTAFLAAPSLVLSSIGFVLAGVGVATGVGIGVSFIYTNTRNNHNRKESLNNLQKIAQASQDKTINIPLKQRFKIATKYAKTNLKMCTTLGGTLAGKFRCVSDFTRDADVEAYNVIENAQLLKDIIIAKNNHKLTSGSQKLEAKIKKKKSLLPSLAKAPQRWKRTYNDFIEGVEIVDHRTEIACLTADTLGEFKKISSTIVPSTSVGGSVIVSFAEQNNKIKQTFARIEDTNKLGAVQQLMINDVLKACNGKSASEINSLFPIVVQQVVYNNKSVSTTKDTVEFRSMSDLQAYVSSSEHIK